MIVRPFGSNENDAVAGLVIMEYAEPHLIKSCIGVVESVGELWCGAAELRTIENSQGFGESLRAQRINELSLESDVPCEVKPGDVVMFKYLANIDEDANIEASLLMRYDRLLARIDGPRQLYPLNGFVILEMSDETLVAGGLHMGTQREQGWGKVVSEGCLVENYLYFPGWSDKGSPSLVGKEVCFRSEMAVRMEHDAYRLLFGDLQYPYYYIQRCFITSYLNE